jgi:hypothetical protein
MQVTMYLLCIVLRVMIPWEVIIQDCALKGTTRKLGEVYLDGSVKHKAEAGVKASITNDQVASKRNRQQKWQNKLQICETNSLRIVYDQ